MPFAENFPSADQRVTALTERHSTLTMVTNLTEGATGYVVDVGLVVGVQLHGSSGARSSRLFMRGRRERMSRR